MNVDFSISRLFYRLKFNDHRTEFFIILGWMLFFPFKDSILYYPGSAALICLFSFRNIYFQKTVAVSAFTSMLTASIFIFIILAFFTVSPLNSILMLSDLLLPLCYFLVFYNDSRSEAGLFRLMFYLLSVFSLVAIVRNILPFFNTLHPLYLSTIHEGVISGLGVTLAIYYLVQKRETIDWIMLGLNICGVFVSRSKAAFIGVVVFSILILLSYTLPRIEKKNRIIFLGALLALFTIVVSLVFIIPNPVKSSFQYTIKKDPYATNRLDIWKMSLTIFNENLVAGVGPGNFAEVCGRYNFKQTRGPANYFKLPNNTHNDYLQVMTESGIIGFLLLLLFLFFIIKRTHSSPFFSLSKILLLFLLFQAFFFNIIFNGFIFFVFLFILKSFFDPPVTFRSFSLKLKVFLSSVLFLVFTVGYLFPAISSYLTHKASGETHPVRFFSLLQKAEYFNPLNSNLFYMKGFYLYNYFKASSQPDAFYEAVNQLKQAQVLNPYMIDAYTLESALYQEVLKKNLKYLDMVEEMLAPLEKAEVYAPVNPFIKLTKAQIYKEFGNMEKAKYEALKALELEPEFVSALYFMQENFRYLGDEKVFREKISAIREKAVRLKVEPGHYLYRLYEIPVP